MIGQVCQRLRAWYNRLESLLRKPWAALFIVGSFMYSIWLSLQQVRIAFRMLAQLGLSENSTFMQIIQSQTVMGAMFVVFVCFNMRTCRILAVDLSWLFWEQLPKIWTSCKLGSRPPQDLVTARNISDTETIASRQNKEMISQIGRRNKLVSVLRRLWAVLLTFLRITFIVWLSFQQVRIAFRMLAQLGLSENSTFMQIIQSYPVIGAMFAVFLFLDLLTCRLLAADLNWLFWEQLPKIWTSCKLGSRPPQDLETA